MKQFRKTWRHEVIIEAKNPKEAKQIWENIDLGKLNREVDNKKISSHEWVEDSCFEDEDYNLLREIIYSLNSRDLINE